MIYAPETVFSSENFIQTSTGNIISRSALICKPQSVEIPSGRCIIEKEVIIRGDFAAVQLNKYCYVGEESVLRPSYTITEPFRFIPLTIGSHSYIGNNCVVESAVIGMGCTIGNNCVLGKRSILKDFVCIMDGTIVPPDMVIPPFSVVSGCPAQIVGERPESATTLLPIEAIARYKSFKPSLKKST
jgi:dynactin-5